jgi:hypothetical protein
LTKDLVAVDLLALVLILGTYPKADSIFRDRLLVADVVALGLLALGLWALDPLAVGLLALGLLVLGLMGSVLKVLFLMHLS